MITGITLLCGSVQGPSHITSACVASRGIGTSGMFRTRGSKTLVNIFASSAIARVARITSTVYTREERLTSRIGRASAKLRKNNCTMVTSITVLCGSVQGPSPHTSASVASRGVGTSGMVRTRGGKTFVYIFASGTIARVARITSTFDTREERLTSRIWRASAKLRKNNCAMVTSITLLCGSVQGPSPHTSASVASGGVGTSGMVRTRGSKTLIDIFASDTISGVARITSTVDTRVERLTNSIGRTSSITTTFTGSAMIDQLTSATNSFVIGLTRTRIRSRGVLTSLINTASCKTQGTFVNINTRYTILIWLSAVPDQTGTFDARVLGDTSSVTRTGSKCWVR